MLGTGQGFGIGTGWSASGRTRGAARRAGNRRVEGAAFTAPIEESLTGILRRFQEQHKLAITGEVDEAQAE